MKLEILSFTLLVFLKKIDSTIQESGIKLPDWKGKNVTVENIHLINENLESENVMINNVAYRGDALKDYRIGLRETNFMLRENYAEMIKQVGHNVYPLIVATDYKTATGCEYILYLRNGTIRHIKPTPVEYETNKNLAHLPVCIFTIISPYFNNPASPMWHQKLKKFQDIVQENLEALNNSGLNNYSTLCNDTLHFEDQKKMLSMVNDYINGCFKTNRVDVEGYQNFIKPYLPFIKKAVSCAAQMQANAAIPELTKWKEQLGPLWRDVYVLIPVVWSVARENPRQQIFETLLDEDRVETHIIKAEGAQSIEEARLVLGRVVADRTMSHIVFGYKDSDTEMNLALSTKIDLMTPDSKKFLESNSPLRTNVPPEEPNEIHFE